MDIELKDTESTNEQGETSNKNEAKDETCGTEYVSDRSHEDLETSNEIPEELARDKDEEEDDNYFFSYDGAEVETSLNQNGDISDVFLRRLDHDCERGYGVFQKYYHKGGKLFSHHRLRGRRNALSKHRPKRLHLN